MFCIFYTLVSQIVLKLNNFLSRIWGQKKNTHTHPSLSDWDCFRSDLNTFNSNIFPLCHVETCHYISDSAKFEKKNKKKKQIRIRCVKNIKFKLVETEILHVFRYADILPRKCAILRCSIARASVGILIKVTAFRPTNQAYGEIRCDQIKLNTRRLSNAVTYAILKMTKIEQLDILIWTKCDWYDAILRDLEGWRLKQIIQILLAISHHVIIRNCRDALLVFFFLLLFVIKSAWKNASQMFDCNAVFWTKKKPFQRNSLFSNILYNICWRVFFSLKWNTLF